MIYMIYIYIYISCIKGISGPQIFGDPLRARPPAAPTPLSRSMLGPGGDLKVWFGL